MNHKRVVKRLPKANGDSTSMREAKLLLNLRHPNIPILYDLEEDEDYYYMVEEYIVGESMADYLYLHQSISHRQLVKVAIELYDLLEFLHGLANPICYQDMKLEHIYLSNGRIVLIDYGISAYLRDNENSTYGTISYASKAQLAGKCDTSNDIFSTKEALRRIYDSSEEKRDIRIERRLRTEEIVSAAEEKKAWIFLNENMNNKKKHLDVKIGVVGNDTGIGVSHIAMSLCSYLNNAGFVSYYEDSCDEGTLEKIIAKDRSFYEKDNIIYHDCFRAFRRSGEAVLEEIPPCGLYIRDCGTKVERAKECDYVVYVVSSRAYKNNELHKIVRMNNTKVIINPAQIRVGVDVAKILGKAVYAFPMDEDPFSISRKKDKIFRRIINGWLD